MSPARVIGVDTVPPQPWRNGGGVTRELLAHPAGDVWRVRVSVADIERDGPFSPFPGVRRHFAVLQGEGVVLEIDGRAVRVTAGGDAVSFDGAAAPGCRLIAGPTRDLNLMVRGGGGGLTRVAANVPWSMPAETRAAANTPQALANAPRPPCGLFATAAGTCRAGGSAIPVLAFALAWFDAAPPSLSFDATGWWLAA